MKPLLVVTAWTPSYRRDAAKLVASADRLGLPTLSLAYADRGSWAANCAYKPIVIRDAIDSHQGPVLWADADAIIWERPEEIEAALSVGFDAVTARGRSGEVLSGTIALAPTAASRRLVLEWAERCGRDPETWDQVHLGRALATFTGREHVMSQRCCSIYDAIGKLPRPIIEHFQASREERAR